MPYNSVSDLPANVRALSPKKQRMWMHVWNSAHKQCSNGGTNDRDDCESRAFAEANGVVLKNKGKAKHSMPKPTDEEIMMGTVKGLHGEIGDEPEWLSDEDVAFKKLSSKAKGDLPRSAFAYVDSTGKGHLPIHDLAHLRNAISRLGQKKTGAKWGLSGDAKKRLQARLQAKLERAQHSYDQSVASDLVAFALDKDNQALVKEPEPGEDVVVRRGRIFRSGDYPDKQFALTPRELKKVVKSFQGPVPLDSEHERSIFDGKLGHLVSVEASEDGTELNGVVAIPRWLDPILMEAGGKVSAAFDRATKKLVGLALTINPRVSDAALMAAFSVDQVVRGGMQVDDLIEMADKNDGKIAKKRAKLEQKMKKQNGRAMADSRDDDDDDDDGDDDQAKNSKKSKFAGYDALIAKGGSAAQSGTAGMADVGGLAGTEKLTPNDGTHSGRLMMQKIHDITASRGAVCRVEPQAATTIGPYGIVRYASKAEMSVVQTIHDTTLQHGASCTPTLYGQRDVPGGTPWTWEWPGITSDGSKSVPGSTKAPHFSEDMSGKALKRFQKFLASMEGIDPRYGPTDEKDGGTADMSDDERFAARERDEEIARLREENRKMKMQHILDRATVFADKMVQEGHATPVEREGIIAVHAQLEHDDTWSATATFSNGMSRVAVYEASILARPNNLLRAELLPDAVQQGLIKFANLTETRTPATQEGAKPSQERIQQLVNLDPVLRKAYADKHGTNGTSK